MRVDLETIELIQALRRAINSISLEDIEFYKDGNKIEISEESVEKFEYTGLSNIDFITTKFYLREE